MVIASQLVLGVAILDVDASIAVYIEVGGIGRMNGIASIHRQVLVEQVEMVEVLRSHHSLAEVVGVGKLAAQLPR